MKKKFILIFLIITFTFSPFLKANSTNSPSPEERTVLIEKIILLIKKINDCRWQIQKTDFQKGLTATSYSIIDISNDSTILSKNIEKVYPIASITKLMSAVVAIENIDQEGEIVLTSKMLKPYGYSPAIHLGKTISAKNLLKAALIQSTNDAAESLTFFLNEGEFISLMNEKAKELNMKNTTFYDAHGLNYLNRASASDIANLIIYVKENHPEILEITREENFQLQGECVGGLCTFKNLNLFHKLKEFIGGKTGYLPAKADQQDAGQTFVGAFNFNEREYVIVLLNAKNRTSDIEKISTWLKRRP
jgi:D-alanyl-D-alanine carboxypeptidase